ncbi:MAG: hypothetical protein JO100_13360 [Pseudonocardia sp.]|nr:hypothetical protein [Pseudonocardia sp.]
MSKQSGQSRRIADERRQGSVNVVEAPSEGVRVLTDEEVAVVGLTAAVAGLVNVTILSA